MADNPPTGSTDEGPLTRSGRWKSVIDMLLGNRINFQNRTGRTPSLENIREDHKQRGLLRSDTNQAPNLSRMPNRVKDDIHLASGTAQGAAVKSSAQQPRWRGPGNMKITPTELAAYELTQRHLQQPIDLFRETLGDDLAEPAFWVQRESRIKYYAEYNANIGKKKSKHAQTDNLLGRLHTTDEEEERDSEEGNYAGPPTSQEKAALPRRLRRVFNGHNKSHHSRNGQEQIQTPGTHRVASAMNAYSSYVLEESLFEHNLSLSPFESSVVENFLAVDRTQRRVTPPSEPASSRIRNYRGVSLNCLNSKRVSNKFLDEFKNLPGLPESEQEKNSQGVTNVFLDELVRSPRLPGSEQQVVQQQQCREKETIIGGFNQQIPRGYDLAERPFSQQQQLGEGETIIDDIIQEIPLAHCLAGEKRQEDRHHAQQHHSLMRSASEGSFIMIRRANSGPDITFATTIDSAGGKHRHSISGGLLRTTSQPAQGKHKITTETRVSELPLHGLPRPTFTPESHTTECQGSIARNADLGRIVLNDFQVVPAIPRRSSSHGQSGGLLAFGSPNFGQRVASSSFIQEDYLEAVFSDDEDATRARGISIFRPPAAHGLMQSSPEGNKDVDRQFSSVYYDSTLPSLRLMPSPYEYQLDPSTIGSPSPQRTGKKDLRAKCSGNRLHVVDDMGTSSPQSTTLARQVGQASGQNLLAKPHQIQQMLQRVVEPRRGSVMLPTTKSMQNASKAYDPHSTLSKYFLEGSKVEGRTHGGGPIQSKRSRDAKKFEGSPMPSDPYHDNSVQELMIESIVPVPWRAKLINQPKHSPHSVGSTMSEGDGLNFLVDNLFPRGKVLPRYENIEVLCSTDAIHRPRQKSLRSMEVVPDDETLQSSADGLMEDVEVQARQPSRAHSNTTFMEVVPDDGILQPSVAGSVGCVEEHAPQFCRAHSTMTSMGEQISRTANSFVSSVRPYEDAPTAFTKISVNEADKEKLRHMPLAKNHLSKPRNQSVFPDKIEGKASIKVIQMMQLVGKRRSEPFMAQTKEAVVRMTRTSLPSRLASGMLGAISTSARSEVEDGLPDFTSSPMLKQESANEDTPQQLKKRKSASGLMMRSSFGFDGAGDERRDYQPKSAGSEKIPREVDNYNSGLLDGQLEWPAGDVDKTSGSNVSSPADYVPRPPSSAANQAREPKEFPKQEIDRNIVQAIKAVSEELPATGTRIEKVLMKGTGASGNPFPQKLEAHQSTPQEMSRRPSSPSKERAEYLLNQYDVKLEPESPMPQQSLEPPRLRPIKSLRKLFNTMAKREFPPLPAVRQKRWPPNPTVEDEEEGPQDILPEEPLLSKHMMVKVAHPDPRLCTVEEFIISDDAPIISEKAWKVSSATEHAGAYLRTDGKPAILTENCKVSFAIPQENFSHQSTKVTTKEKPATENVVRKVSFPPEHPGHLDRTGEKPPILKPIKKIFANIEYGVVNDQMPVGARSPSSDAEGIAEWSLLEDSHPTHRKVEVGVRDGQEVPLDVVPELYRRTDVVAHAPQYMKMHKDRTTGRGDFEGYMAVLPSYLQDPDFPLVPISLENRKEAKIVLPASRGGAARCVPDLLTHVSGTFRRLFGGEQSMTTDPAKVPLPRSPDGGSFNWDDEEVDSFGVFEEGSVKLFKEEPSGTTDPAHIPLPGSPVAGSVVREDEEVDSSDNFAALQLFDVPLDREQKMGMKLKRHFSSSWRLFPHKIVEPHLVSIPNHIRFRIYQMLLPFSHQHPVLLSPVATTLKFWPERSFRCPSDVFDRIGPMTLTNRQFRDEMMAFYLSQLRFHITLNCRISESLAPKMWQWLPLFANQIQYLTVEIDFTKGSGDYKDGCALRLDGVAELEELLGKVIVPLSKRDTPMRGLTIMARRYVGNRPSGQLVPYNTLTSPYQGNEIIGGQGLGNAKQPDEEKWSIIDGLTALPDFGDEDDELFYYLPHQKPMKENRWKHWLNIKTEPTKPAQPRDKLDKPATANRLAQKRRPSGFKITALRLLTGKSPMPDLNETLFAKTKPECRPMSLKPPPEPPRQKWYAHFSPTSARGPQQFPGLGTSRTTQMAQMSLSSAQPPSAHQRVFVPTSEVFTDQLPLFDGRRGSAMMGNWSTRVETALGASVAAIEAREKALKAHTQYGYDGEQDKRQKRIKRIKKMSYGREMTRRIKREQCRWFMSKKAARRKRVATRQTKIPSLRRSSGHGRHRKALRRRHEKINMARKDKSLRRRTMPKYRYRVFHAMEQLYRGSIPNTVTIFKKKGFFRTGKGKRHVAILKRRPQTSRAGMLMSSPYLPHDAVDKTLETLVACFGPPNGPGFLFLRLSGFTKERSEEVCMKLVCKAMPVQLKSSGRRLWPKEAVGTFGKRRAGARFARFEVFEEANSPPKRRGRIIKIEDKEEDRQQSSYRNKELANVEQQYDDRKKDLVVKEPQPDDEELAGVFCFVVDAQAYMAEGFDAQRATMKKKAEVEHKHARQEFEFKTSYDKRIKRKLKAMEEQEAADLRKGTTHVSRFMKKQFKKARSQVGERNKWQASGMEDDDYDDYRAFR